MLGGKAPAFLKSEGRYTMMVRFGGSSWQARFGRATQAETYTVVVANNPDPGFVFPDLNSPPFGGEDKQT
jgi:hypothetical protein